MNATSAVRLASIASLALALAGCASGPPPKTWEEERAEKVHEFMLHLNNDNVKETWRNGLIEVGQRSPDDRAYVHGECERAFAESLAQGGRGTGVLRSPGRRRVMEVIGALEKTPEGEALLRQGLEDTPEVRVAAAAALASWGHDDAVSVLLQTVLVMPDYDPYYKTAVKDLRRAATVERRELFLNALSERESELLRQLITQTLPVEKAGRLEVLREVAAKHANPYARAHALERLVAEEDPQVLSLAKAALESGDPIVRPAALEALGASGGNQAADQLETVLRQQPDDPAPVVRGLFEVGTEEALTRALNVFADGALGTPVRAAVARGFFARMAEPSAPAFYREVGAREEALDALRAVLDSGDQALTIAAIEAIAAIGERTTDAEPLAGLLRDTSKPLGEAVVAALGKLGGQYAAAKLVELLAVDPELRVPASRALAGYAEPAEVPLDDLIDLLDDEQVVVREAAIEALLGLARTKDRLGYDPEGDEGTRTSAMERWRALWRARRG